MYMGTTASFIFRILKKIKISHFYVFKNYSVKYLDRYIQKVCMQKKVQLKNTLYFGKIKKAMLFL
jgi:hypothetical protein